MDIDVLSTDEQMALMKKEACFNCKEVRHLSRDCLKKGKRDEKKEDEKKKWKGKEMVAYIRAQILAMDQAEKDAFYENATELGF